MPWGLTLSCRREFDKVRGSRARVNEHRSHTARIGPLAVQSRSRFAMRAPQCSAFTLAGRPLSLLLRRVGSRAPGRHRHHGSTRQRQQMEHATGVPTAVVPAVEASVAASAEQNVSAPGAFRGGRRALPLNRLPPHGEVGTGLLGAAPINVQRPDLICNVQRSYPPTNSSQREKG
eukprot:TRINITY_DN167_c0_g2_i11.p1 TRINITY_DN167_c0_g2~~TRINITY_DN167_c0_g2_i11.p1  ORF type:complete len:175 (-),score=1.02 TRINITY_DN167_c0_g2_i11:105-629(-)